MIALRATVRFPGDPALTPALWSRLLRHSHVPMGPLEALALLPGVGSAILTRRSEWLEIDLVTDSPALVERVMASLDRLLRGGELGEGVAISWTRPDIVPVRLR